MGEWKPWGEAAWDSWISQVGVDGLSAFNPGIVALLVFLFEICAVLLTIASVILAVLGVALFFTPTPIGGIVFLFLAFFLSPYGLQAAAGSLLWALDGGKSALYRFLAS